MWNPLAKYLDGVASREYHLRDEMSRLLTIQALHPPLSQSFLPGLLRAWHDTFHALHPTDADRSQLVDFLNDFGETDLLAALRELGTFEYEAQCIFCTGTSKTCSQALDDGWRDHFICGTMKYGPSICDGCVNLFLTASQNEVGYVFRPNLPGADNFTFSDYTSPLVYADWLDENYPRYSPFATMMRRVFQRALH
jgi:hypothetical protein